MQRRLLAWVQTVLQLPAFGGSAGGVPSVSLTLLDDYEMSVRRTATLIGSNYREAGAAYLLSQMGAEEFLDFVDFLVFTVDQLGGTQGILHSLDQILLLAGSEWRVGDRDGHAALEKRVPEGVADAATEVIASSGSAGRLLAEAWRAAFGRSPDPEDAYEKAIKAVEEAGASVVAPRNQRTTLGTMIRDMKAQGDWALELAGSDADVPVRMAEALWTGQASRHGGNGYQKPTAGEAEAAVLLAVPLVQWFSTDAIQRRHHSE